MRDLIEFLYARLEEDVKVSRDAKQGYLGWLSTLQFRTPDTAVQAAYVMHWQPSRIVNDIEAKYRRMEIILNSPGMNDEARQRLLLCEALPYMHHPDFRDEWRRQNPAPVRGAPY